MLQLAVVPRVPRHTQAAICNAAISAPAPARSGPPQQLSPGIHRCTACIACSCSGPAHPAHVAASYQFHSLLSHG